MFGGKPTQYYYLMINILNVAQTDERLVDGRDPPMAIYTSRPPNAVLSNHSFRSDSRSKYL